MYLISILSPACQELVKARLMMFVDSDICSSEPSEKEKVLSVILDTGMTSSSAQGLWPEGLHLLSVT